MWGMLLERTVYSRPFWYVVVPGNGLLGPWSLLENIFVLCLGKAWGTLLLLLNFFCLSNLNSVAQRLDLLLGLPRLVGSRIPGQTSSWVDYWWNLGGRGWTLIKLYLAWLSAPNVGKQLWRRVSVTLAVNIEENDIDAWWKRTWRQSDCIWNLCNKISVGDQPGASLPWEASSLSRALLPVAAHEKQTLEQTCSTSLGDQRLSCT